MSSRLSTALTVLLVGLIVVHLPLSVHGQDFTEEEGDSDERRLLTHLLFAYDSELRPVIKKEDVVTVSLGLSLHQIIAVHERNQIIVIGAWIRQVWYNSLLTWNASAFGGIRSINVDPRRVWKPDLYLYNNANEGGDGSLDRFKTKVVLSNNGKNMWLAPVILKSSCKIDVKWFPFDEQFCNLKIGSWTYDGFKLDLVPEMQSGETTKFVNNGEWDLIELPCKRNEIFYVCCPEPYPDVTFTIRIRRRTLFYYVNLIIPCYLITGLTLLSFFLPPDSGERIALVITNLLALTVFMLLVAEILPPSSEVIPLISVYYSGTMFEVGVSLVATCLVLRCHFRTPSMGEMPSWLRILVLNWMARLLRINISLKGRQLSSEHRSQNPHTTSTLLEEDKPNDESQLNNSHTKRPSTTSNGYLSTSEAPEIQTKRRFSQNPVSTSTSRKYSAVLDDEVFERNIKRLNSTMHLAHIEEHPDKCSKKHCSRLHQQQEELIKYVKIIADMHTEKEEEESQKEEWMVAATIIDTFFMWVFILTLFLSTLIIFMQAPQYDDP